MLVYVGVTVDVRVLVGVAVDVTYRVSVAVDVGITGVTVRVDEGMGV